MAGAMVINATVDSGRLMQSLQAFPRQAGLTVQFLAWDVMRLMCLDMVRYSAGWAGEGRLGSFAAQHKTGTAAVEHDIDKIFAKFSAAKFVKWVNKNSGLTFLKDKESGMVFSIDAAHNMLDADESALAGIHEPLRNSRGRVKYKDPKQIWVKQSAYRSYVKSVQKRVGELKAGWLPAMLHWAARTHGSAGRIPQWIVGQMTRAGAFGGNMDKSGSGSIWSRNVAHHANAIRHDTLQFVVRKRERDLNHWARVRVERLVNQFNAATTMNADLKPIPEAA